MARRKGGKGRKGGKAKMNTTMENPFGKGRGRKRGGKSR